MMISTKGWYALRGKGGGYRLNRQPEEYSVKSVIEQMEGPQLSGTVYTGGSHSRIDIGRIGGYHGASESEKCARPAFPLSGRWLR